MLSQQCSYHLSEYLIRLASTFFFPPIAGWIAQTLFAGIKPG